MIAYLKRIVRNYFGFSGNQITGFLVLIPLMLVLVFSAPVYRYWIYSYDSDFSQETAFLDSLVFTTSVSVKAEAPASRTFSFSNFNPNTATAKELVQFGFPNFLANRIVQYRSKGGVFRIKSDLSKIYGLDPELYREAEPYIQLPDRQVHHTPPVNKTNTERFTPPEILPFDLNTADTTQLRQISGIGTVLSSRIIKYRKQLGGFTDPHQLTEVYQLDSITIARLLEHAFIEESFRPREININLATESELRRHPYISNTIARAIVTYRFQHGKFNSLDELSKIIILTPGDREKIQPYLSLE